MHLQCSPHRHLRSFIYFFLPATGYVRHMMAEIHNLTKLNERCYLTFVYFSKKLAWLISKNTCHNRQRTVAIEICCSNGQQTLFLIDNNLMSTLPSFVQHKAKKKWLAINIVLDQSSSRIENESLENHYLKLLIII